MRRTVTIVFFLFVVASPALGWITGFRADVHENRVPAKLPAFTVNSLIDRKFYLDLSKFHDDRFPYRGWFISGKNYVDLNIFKMSPSWKVTLGEKGWLFYSDTIDDYFKNSCSQKNRIRASVKQLHELERVLEASGRKLIFVVAPNKATIYPEYVGLERPVNDCMKSRYDLLLEALEEFPVKGFVRLDNLLIKGKEEQQVYNKTDTHWNIYGAMIASKAILGKITPAWEEIMPNIEISLTTKKFDLANMATILRPEETPYADNISDVSNVIVEEKSPLENGRPRLKITATTYSPIQLLPKTIMYRDSFMTAPLEIIKGSFEQIDALWTVNIPTRRKVEAEELGNAKIVFIEVVERNLAALNVEVNEFD